MYHTDIKKLQARLVECDTTQEALASEMGIDRSTLRRRLNTDKLTVGDIHKICSVLGLSRSTAMEIFLAE